MGIAIATIGMTLPRSDVRSEPRGDPAIWNSPDISLRLKHANKTDPVYQGALTRKFLAVVTVALTKWMPQAAKGERQLMSASVMRTGVKLPRFILPLVRCFCPWTAWSCHIIRSKKVVRSSFQHSL
jgi:hypothetical protein